LAKFLNQFFARNDFGNPALNKFHLLYNLLFYFIINCLTPLLFKNDSILKQADATPLPLQDLFGVWRNMTINSYLSKFEVM